MNKIKLRITAIALVCTLCIVSLPAAQAFTKESPQIPFIPTFSKMENPGSVVTFSQADFSSRLAGSDTLDAIVINALPPTECGVLKAAGVPVTCGEGFSASAINSLTFEPAASANVVHTQFSFIPVFGKYGAGNKSVNVSINLDSAKNSAPIAENISLETYKDLELRSEFSSTDPDGDPCEFIIFDAPKKGEILVLGDIFVYSPKAGDIYKDSFTYCAIDNNGNSSNPATVKISVKKRAAKEAISYADLMQNSAHYSAIKLAEAGIFNGTSIGNTRFFEPEKEVTRAEFISMVMAATDVSIPTSAISSGLADDAQIPAWAKGTSAAALNSGIVKGSPNGNGSRVLRADETITFAEAITMLDRAAGLPSAETATVFSDTSALPAWAAQSACNAVNCGIIKQLDFSAKSHKPITRADAAKLIYNAIKLPKTQLK